jgi:tight adherence protein C
MELCIGIQAALACLAILSRIHFSKYKDGDIKGLKHIREEVQALRVLTRREAQTLVRTRVKQLVWTTIAILFASTCIAEGLLFKSMQQSERLDTQVVKRTNYDGKVKTEDIRLSVDDKEYTYTMEIEPREYTEEEFYQQAQQRITELESEILGDNPDLEHVSRSLNLPGEDATGVFTYAWRSDNPAVLSSYGKVDLEEVTETVIVLLKGV